MIIHLAKLKRPRNCNRGDYLETRKKRIRTEYINGIFRCLPDRRGARGGHASGGRSQRLLFISLEGPRRPLFYIREFRRDPIVRWNAGNTSRRLRQVTKNGSEDGLHYLVLSMRGTTLAAVRATWLEKERPGSLHKKMGQAWCKEKTSKAQDSKSPLDRVFVRCAHRVCYENMFYFLLRQLINN